MISTIRDGLRNVVAKLGVERDKASHSTYHENELSEQDLRAMYRSSAVARKIVDLPAEDSLREWREWQGDANTISLIEAEEKRLGLQGKLLKASKRGRLYGGCAVFIGTGEEDLTKPLDPSKITKGGVKYLSVVNRSELHAGELEQDPRLPYYGKPKMYTMSGGGEPIDIHPSRLVLLQGEELPDERYGGTNHGWSDPVLNALLTDVRNLDATVANVASLVFEAKIDIVGIHGFNEGLRSGGQQYEDTVVNRASLTSKGKSINSTLVMDAQDVYNSKNTSFASLPDIIDRFMQMASAASSIPMTLLFGMSPGGLNATGDSDTRGYYDRIKVVQTLELEPAMEILTECLIRSATGARATELHYNWKPLWQPTTKERAETGKTIAETFKIVAEGMGIPDEAISNAVVNTLTESGLAPGLEKDYKKFGGFATPPTGGEGDEFETGSEEVDVDGQTQEGTVE